MNQSLYEQPSRESQNTWLDHFQFLLCDPTPLGALSVGRIVQTHPLDKPFERG
jgi:hypothetical protein